MLYYLQAPLTGWTKQPLKRLVALSKALILCLILQVQEGLGSLQDIKRRKKVECYSIESKEEEEN